MQTILENDTQSSVEFTGKTTGVYLVKVTTDNGVKIQKVIKE